MCVCVSFCRTCALFERVDAPIVYLVYISEPLSYTHYTLCTPRTTHMYRAVPGECILYECATFPKPEHRYERSPMDDGKADEAAATGEVQRLFVASLERTHLRDTSWERGRKEGGYIKEERGCVIGMHHTCYSSRKKQTHTLCQTTYSTHVNTRDGRTTFYLGSARHHDPPTRTRHRVPRGWPGPIRTRRRTSLREGCAVARSLRRRGRRAGRSFQVRLPTRRSAGRRGRRDRRRRRRAGGTRRWDARRAPDEARCCSCHCSCYCCRRCRPPS